MTCASYLQDTLDVVHNADFVLRHKLFATLSSGELKNILHHNDNGKIALKNPITICYEIFLVQ